jgi:hypothetical protein
MTVTKREPVAATEISELIEAGAPERAASSADRALLGDGQTDPATGGSSNSKCRALGAEAGKTNRHKIRVLAERLQAVDDAHKRDRAALIEKVKEADVDPGTLRRLTSWMRVDPARRAERQALDHQYRYLAGEVPEPAAVPEGTSLSRVVKMLREHESITVRQIAEAMGVSVGKAHKLKVQAEAFTVHEVVNMNAREQERRSDGRRDSSNVLKGFQPMSPPGSALTAHEDLRVKTVEQDGPASGRLATSDTRTLRQPTAATASDAQDATGLRPEHLNRQVRKRGRKLRKGRKRKRARKTTTGKRRDARNEGG